MTIDVWNFDLFWKNQVLAALIFGLICFVVSYGMLNDEPMANSQSNETMNNLKRRNAVHE